MIVEARRKDEEEEKGGRERIDMKGMGHGIEDVLERY